MLTNKQGCQFLERILSLVYFLSLSVRVAIQNKSNLFLKMFLENAQTLIYTINTNWKLFTKDIKSFQLD